MVTKVLDIDAEVLVRHFCLENECEELVKWMAEKGYERPDGCDERLALAQRLKESGNKCFEVQDFAGAMMHALAALHCVDFSQGRSFVQNDEQKQQTNNLIVAILSNLSLVFLKRDDAYNSVRAADCGLQRVKKMDAAESDAFRAKLLFRRGLARGQERDFAQALTDLKEAARLSPSDRQVRKAYENCKVAVSRQRGAPDDAWRGLLTESPDEARRDAQRKRKIRRGREVAQEILGACRKRENLKVIVLVILGPLVGILTPFLLSRYRGR